MTLDLDIDCFFQRVHDKVYCSVPILENIQNDTHVYIYNAHYQGLVKFEHCFAKTAGTRKL